MAIRTGTQRLFGTPLVVDTIEDPQMIADLEKTILDKRKEDAGIRRSNTGGGWHSDLQLLHWGGPAAKKLMRRVMALVNRNTTDVAGGPSSQIVWQADAWANVNEKGGANLRHVHGGCYWSAVFYVRVDEGTGGELVLHDPRMPTLAMHAPYLRFHNAGGERQVKLKPGPGLLIMFPSWLAHEVEPWYGEGLRISIAINLMASRSRQGKAALMQKQRATTDVATPDIA